MLSPLVRERYPINYIYGFSSEGFSYFLTTQMKQTSPSPYESKIVRVCHDDSDYYSYTEVRIQSIITTYTNFYFLWARMSTVPALSRLPGKKS
jgi:plexin A